MKNLQPITTLFVCLISFLPLLKGQKAQIEEIRQSIKTYPFSDPNPIPVLTSNPKIYPYHKFEGYAVDGQMQDWKVIHLENEHIELWVLPEVGGKIWGAREKSSGQEFIYRNEVLKFRNIAMRGPWTSGGIEFNFGIIGHTPATATPVDYKIMQEEDGTVSCVVGATDWPSRTDWRVKISLGPNDNYFTTEVLWYNGTGLNQSYYNWMTAAAFAQEDLEFYCPGNQYLKHSGEARPWPYEYNRHLAEYQENNFTSSKSYHVVGEFNDFFGGYFKDQGYGFGHWALYDEMPGQKLWLWSLARDGGIWEDLLTDTDGQYIEFQAGRLFNQHFSGGHNNPVTQAFFPPYATDQWTEKWFPVLKIGGLTDVSSNAVLHVENQGEDLKLGLQALTDTKGNLTIKNGEQVLYEESIMLESGEIYQKQLSVKALQNYSISIPEMDLNYQAHSDSLLLKRPFQQPPLPDQTDQWYQKGLEHSFIRAYEEAEHLFHKVLNRNPSHLDALTAIAELRYRQGRYKEALDYALAGLRIDTYAAHTNFVAGLIYKAQHDWINAMEAFGWAARSMAYRSAAYGLMAEVELINQQIDRAIHYANRALDFNRLHLNAYKILAICYRINANQPKRQTTLSTLLDIDPLNHFAQFEQLLDQNKSATFPALIQSELPEQTLLELGIDYFNKGQREHAKQLLALLPQNPLAICWNAFIEQDPKLLNSVTEHSADFIFPYRRESLPVLAWANQYQSHWKLKYYLALNLLDKQRINEAKILLDDCQNEANIMAFYQTRAHFQADTIAKEKDLQRGYLLNPKDWRSMHTLFDFHFSQKQFQKALEISNQGFKIHPANYSLGIDYAKALIYNQRFAEAIQVLKTLQVLPFEGAGEGRQLYEWANYGYALSLIEIKQYEAAIPVLEASKAWPENLGVGKPFEPDERFANYLLYHIYNKLGKLDQAQPYKVDVLAYHYKAPTKNTYKAVFSLQLMSNSELNNQLIHLYDDPKRPKALDWAIAYITDKSLAGSLTDSNTSLELQLIKRALALKVN